MVITESIREAIQNAVRKSGSVLSFAHTIGVSHTTVTYWLTGRTRKINSTVWQNLLPLIGEDLNPGEVISYPYSPVAAAGASRVLREQSAIWYGQAQKMSAPMLHLSDLADFDPQIDPVEEIIRKKSKGAAAFTSQITPGHFAVEIDKAQKSCFFPVGTRLLLRWPDAPCDGDTVLVKLRDKKEFLFAVYTRKSREIVLTPLQKGGGKRIIPKTEFHNICSWIVSIREAVQLF